MTNSISEFTPSSLIQEAAENESYFNPMVEYRTITPEDPEYQFLTQAPQIIELEPSPLESLIASIDNHSFITTLPGVIEPEDPEYQYATQVMKQAGFDEAEPEITTSEVELIPTDSSQMTDNISIDPFMNLTFGDLVPDSLRPSTYVIGAGEHLQGNGWESLGMGVEAAGQTIRSFGFDEAVGNSDEKHISPFPFWDVVEPTTETEAVGHPRGLFPLPDFSDQSANVDERQNAQVDAVTGYSLNNDDAAGFDWFQMHHDDGIMDGYLDTAEGEFSSNPETLTPFNIDNALVTDAYQQQDAPGADLIAGEVNQGMDPSQAQGGRYEVLA